MATVQQYVNQMRNTQLGIAEKLGSTITDKRLRILLAVSCVPSAVLIKVLVDKGIVTNLELQTTLDAALNDVWPEAEDPTA